VVRKAEQHTLGAEAGTIPCTARRGAAVAEHAGHVELTRNLLVVPLVLALSPAASAAQGTGTGGAVAEPPRQGEGGGALAPERYAAPSPSAPGTTGGAPAAEATSVTGARTRREEPRDTQWAPSPKVGERRGGEVSLDAVDEQPAARAEASVSRAASSGSPAAISRTAARGPARLRVAQPCFFLMIRTFTGARSAKVRASSSLPMCSPQCIGTATRGWMRRAASAAS
jgi:hypothetical protein